MNKLYYYAAGALIVMIGLYYFLIPTKADGNEKSIVKTTMPTLDKTFDKGAQLYTENCAQCHGKTLGGVVGNGPPFVHGYYNSGHHGDAAFYRAVSEGVQAHHWRFGDMPKIESLTRDDAQRIVAYIRAVQKYNDVH